MADYTKSETKYKYIQIGSMRVSDYKDSNGESSYFGSLFGNYKGGREGININVEKRKNRDNGEEFYSVIAKLPKDIDEKEYFNNKQVDIVATIDEQKEWKAKAKKREAQKDEAIDPNEIDF